MINANGSLLFTQYVRPDGHRKTISIPCEQVLLDKAQTLIDANYVFEIEVLRSGLVSMTVEKDEGDDVVCASHYICSNEPDSVRLNVEQLITEAFDFVSKTAGA